MTTTFQNTDEVFIPITFIPITWPDIQQLMDKDGFENNSILINSEPLLTEYGSSAYLVRLHWLELINFW